MTPDPRAGLGPIYYLCPLCKGSGGQLAPALFDVKGERGKRTVKVSHDGKCGRCLGWGMVLEDRSRR